MGRIRVFLADDHALFREGLASILAAAPDFEVVGEAGDGVEAVVKVGELMPDLVLMDIGMPGCDGLEATRQIKQGLPSVTIVILTVRSEDDKLFEAIKSGAQGYLLKSICARDLLDLLRGAVQGEAAISPALAGRMLEEFRRLSRRPRALFEQGPALTQREKEVLTLIAEGATNREIAQSLYLSLHTVKTHTRNILSKLHVSSRYEAAQHARSQELLQR